MDRRGGEWLGSGEEEEEEEGKRGRRGASYNHRAAVGSFLRGLDPYPRWQREPPRAAARRGEQAASGFGIPAPPARPNRRGATCHPVSLTCAWATVAASAVGVGPEPWLAGRGWPTKGSPSGGTVEAACRVVSSAANAERASRRGLAVAGMSGRARGAPQGRVPCRPMVWGGRAGWRCCLALPCANGPARVGCWRNSGRVHGSIPRFTGTDGRLGQLCGQDPRWFMFASTFLLCSAPLLAAPHAA